MSNFENVCYEVISGVQKLLDQNQEWIKRYEKYSHTLEVKNKLDQIIRNKKKFREWRPLYLYMNLGQAMGQMLFSLRYRGQDVAKLSVGKEDISITTDKYFEKNKEHFGCEIELSSDPICKWTSQKAKKFRKYFSDNPTRNNSRKGNEEHRIESLLLTEFTKKKSADKQILNIQPVRIANVARFQLPTPLTASDVYEIGYSAGNGGGIDIISRIGVGRATKLCIMEVKDENTTKEPPAKVILQGLAYAKFVRELLRSDSGEKWWNIFGFKGKCPNAIEIYVVCVMPSTSNNDISFEGKVIKASADGRYNDTFVLHNMYFNEANNKFSNITTSLPQCKANPNMSDVDPNVTC